MRVFYFDLLWLGNFETSGCFVGRLACTPATTGLTPQPVGISVTDQQPQSLHYCFCTTCQKFQQYCSNGFFLKNVVNSSLNYYLLCALKNKRNKINFFFVAVLCIWSTRHQGWSEYPYQIPSNVSLSFEAFPKWTFQISFSIFPLQLLTLCASHFCLPL